MKQMSHCPLCGQTLPFYRRRVLFWEQVAVFILAGIVGFCISYILTS